MHLSITPDRTSAFIQEQFAPVTYLRGTGIGNLCPGGYYDAASGVCLTGQPADQRPQSTSSTITGSAIGAASLGFQTALTTGSKVLGGVAAGLMAAAPFAGPAAPFLSLAAGLVGPIGSMFKGCGNTCVEATKIADQAQFALEQVRDKYFAQPVRYKASQVAALYAVEQVIGYINQACGNPALGAAGQRCISERTVRGGTAPWCPTGRGCDYWTEYYDPIANDPDVVPDPQGTAVSGAGAGAGAAGTGSGVAGFAAAPMPLLLLIGAAALVLFVVGGSGSGSEKRNVQ